MADTLDQIYMNTALGATQMDDGEETILTTNATTSYVIKDMNVQNTSILYNTYLELNGFNVGSVTSNATGSLIIPPSSTLKIKTSEYPYTYTNKEIYFIDQSNDGYYKSTIAEDGSSADPTVVVEAGGSSNLAIQQATNTIAMRYVQPVGSADAFFHTASHDTNSVQNLYYSRLAGGTGTAQGTNRSKNYRSHGFHDLPGGGYSGIISDGNDVESFPLSTAPTTTTPTIIGNYNNTPRSSFPRGLVFGGYLWWIMSNSYNNAIYAMNITTGYGLAMTGLSTESVAGGSNRHFAVSLDPTTDKFYIWRPNSASQVQVIETNDTKTVLDAKTADYTAPTTVVTARSNLPVSVNESNMSSSVLTPQPDGTISYGTSASEYINIDKNLTEVGARGSLSSMTVNGTGSLSALNRLYTEINKPATSAQVTSAGLSPPVFGIQLLGVKSEGT